MRNRIWPTTPAHQASNVHPNYRSLWLNHIRQLRRMRREGRYMVGAQIKDAQRNMLAARRALAIGYGREMSAP